MNAEQVDTRQFPSQSQDAQFRQVLEKERRRLLQRSGEDGDGRALGRNPDRTDLAQAYASRERDLTLSTLEQEQLEQIEAALQRLDDGTYGRCARCGQSINPERLEVLPYATLCITCQRQQEQV
ncbi:MAG: TraR/DksA C4-type zinc finger protein [Ardenticatenaceae bacterium]|nr:TraR/DksA C4-type zinc finger protein [Anaerolineales bacterium]MCB8985745.1 TraR/DksA C4-type zinc finger protein [Ardenticatenaceae bacterium]